MKNRWLIALSAIGIHICIGSVYAWSVLTKPIMQAMGFTLKETTWTFSIAILFLGLSAGFLGDYVEKYGPRKSGLTSTCFFGLGMFGTALALHLNSLPLLYLFYGVIGGIGLGTGYITPVSTLVKWFPNNRGFATGLAIMGFGFASLIAGPLMQILVAKYGLVQNFIILGCVYMVIMAASALYLEPPKASNGGPSGINVKSILPDTQFTAKEARKTWQFYALWWIFFTNITCGIGLFSSFTDGTGSSKNDTDGSRLHGRYHRSDQRSRPHFLVYYFRLSRAQHGLCSLFPDPDLRLLRTCRNKQCFRLSADRLCHHFLLRRRLLLYARLPQRSVRHERAQRHTRQDPDCLGHGRHRRSAAAVLDP